MSDTLRLVVVRGLYTCFVTMRTVGLWVLGVQTRNLLAETDTLTAPIDHPVPRGSVVPGKVGPGCFSNTTDYY